MTDSGRLRILFISIRRIKCREGLRLREVSDKIVCSGTPGRDGGSLTNKKKEMMKIVFMILLCFLIGEAGAQNRSIDFRSGEWNAVLKQAQKEKKMIFVDGYTSWCGPCKVLANTVFTNDTVADFYNRHFVNVKMDMEKGEGPELAKRYEVRAFPTLLYIDQRGNLVHCVVGFQEPQKLIAEGETAMNGGNTLAALQKKYEAGDRTPEFVRQYMKRLSEAYRPKLQQEVATEYIHTLSEEQFYSRDCWNIMILNINDPLSPLIKKMLANRARFYQIIARDSVDLFLDYTFRSKVSGFTWWEASKGAFRQKTYDELVAYLLTLNLPKVPQYLASLYAARKMADEDYRGMLDEMYKALSYGFFHGDDQLDFIRNYMLRLEKSGHTELIRESCDWMDRLIAESRVGYHKSEYMKLKAGLIRALGDEEQATELEEQARGVRMG